MIADARGGHGNLNEPTGPTQMARNLGMPSAMKQQQQRGGNKDWSSSSNRINMGAPVYMKVSREGDDTENAHGGVRADGG